MQFLRGDSGCRPYPDCIGDQWRRRMPWRSCRLHRWWFRFVMSWFLCSYEIYTLVDDVVLIYRYGWLAQALSLMESFWKARTHCTMKLMPTAEEQLTMTSWFGVKDDANDAACSLLVLLVNDWKLDVEWIIAVVNGYFCSHFDIYLVLEEKMMLMSTSHVLNDKKSRWVDVCRESRF